MYRHLEGGWTLRVADNGNSHARETPVAQWGGRLLYYWLDVRAEQGIPGSMVVPSTRSTGKPWGKVPQYLTAKDVLAVAGIDGTEGGSFRLRHTFALRHLRRGHGAGRSGPMAWGVGPGGDGPVPAGHDGAGGSGLSNLEMPGVADC